MKISKNIFKQVVSITISILLVFPLQLSAMEPVVVDNASAAKYQANLETARNGVPIINIVKPDASGLSHNKFLNYNVEKQGLILNNSNQLQVTTQLGGVIYGNTNLTNANSANRILNEVTSLNKSTLAGYTEVAGSKASVIVANPNGIFVKGGGFINTPKVTLTTGVPQFTADQLRSYKITQGIIEIGDENFNIENIDKLDLYAKALKFNSKIYAKDINIITGTNDISINGDVTPIDMVNNDLFSLDSTALGGIYADKIRLIGTSSGVGVNLPAEIIAKDDIIISLDGKLTFKKLLSNGNIDIKSDTINAMDATAETYKTLSIYASDILVNNSNLSSSNNVYINASDSLDITNSSKLTAKNNLDIFAHSQDLKLSNILLSSDNSMKIESKSLINNIDLQANGNLIVETINGNLVNNKLLQSQKDLTLNISGDILNKAAIVSLNDMKVYTTNLTNYNTIYSAQDMNLYVDNLLLNKTDATKVSGIDNARLYAVENIFLSKDESLQNINEVQNYKGVIQTQKGNIDIFADTLKNITDTTEKIVEVQSTRSVYSSAWWHEYLRGSIYTYIDKNEKFSPAPDKFSSIASANNLSIYSNNLFNYISDISAQNNINLAVTNISNDSEKLYSTQTTKIQIYNCYSACYSSRSSNPSFRWENYGSPATIVTGEIGSLDATISAGNNIIGDFTNLENVTAHAAIAQSDIFTDVITTKNSTRYIDKDDYVTPTNPYGLFVKSTKHEYLIESNPLYTDISNFIGSEYFLNKMGYDGDAISKRLGDAMYETKLVKDSLKRLTGKQHKKISYVSLMDNAVEISQSVDLKLGEAPTSEQLASIDKDIVWMETKIVDGEEVLVPVVYLADNSNKSSGSVISAGNELNLNVENSIVNSGELTAENNLNISAKSIKNEQGAISSNKDTTINSETSIENITSIITAAGTTNLTAKENITNSNGSTISGTSVAIESTDASVVNETSTKTTVVKNDANGNRYEVVSTKVGTESKIISNDGNIFIKAKDNIKNSAANISATNGDINLVTTDGDIELNVKELTDKADFSAGRSFTKTNNTKHISSQLNANSINLQSGSDIQVKASNITAKDTLTLDANKEINILAVNDIEYKDVQSYKKGNFGSSKSKRDMKYKESVVGSQLNANDISLISSGDINLQSANINAKKVLSATTDGNLNIVAKEYKEGELHESTKKGFLGLSSKVSVDASEYLKLKSSKLTLSHDDFKQADDAMNLKSNNLNILASQVDGANKDININVQDSATIQAGYEQATTKKYTKKSGLFSGGALYSKTIDLEGKKTTTSKNSTLNAENITINVNEQIAMIGADLRANENVDLSAKNVNILNATDTQQTYSKHTKMKIDLGDTLNAIFIPTPEFKDGTFSQTLAKGTYDKETEVVDKTIVKTSNIEAKNININASALDAKDGNILVQASNIKADEDIDLVASNDVIIKEDKDTTSTKSKELHGKVELKATIKNEFVQVGYALDALADATKALAQSKKDYDTYKTTLSEQQSKLVKMEQEYKEQVGFIELSDVEEFRELVDDLKSDDAYYKANIALATATLATATAAVAAQGAKAGASTPTLGFNAGMNLNIDAIEKAYNAYQEQSVGSNLEAKNINLTASNTAIVQGSNLKATNDININANETNILASQDNSNSQTDTQHKNMNLGITVYGGPSASVSSDMSNSSTDSTSFTNSQLQANNIVINTNETTTIKGANLKAEDTLAINSKNLNIESVQNRQKSRNKSNGFSAGFGASGLQSLGVNKSSGSLDSKETLLTDLRGNSVNITTQEQTKLRGATIAAVDSQGNDNSQLALNTDTLLASSLNNRVDSKNKSLSINIGGNVEENTLNNVALDYSNDTSNQKTKTLATIGTGTINITNTDDSELKMLNRDIQDNEVDIYNIQSHKGLKTEIDTRLLTEDGRKQIAKDFKVSSLIVDSVSDIVKENELGISDYFSHTEKTYAMFNGINKKIQTDKDLAKALANPDLSPQQKQQMYKEVINAVAIELGYTKPQTLLVSTDVAGKDNEQVKGHYNSGTIYLNDKNILSISDGIQTAGHEIMHMDSTTTENYANLMGDKLLDYTLFGLSNYTDTSLATTNSKTEPQSALEYIQLQQNNSEFALVDKSFGEDLTIFVHGTNSSPKDADPKFIEAMKNTYNEDIVQFEWSGANSKDVRIQAAEKLKQLVENHDFKDGEQLNITGHSHGGNVNNKFTTIYNGKKKIDNYNLLATPVRDDYIIDYTKFSNNANIKNVYDTSDLIQKLGGIDTEGSNKKFGLADRIIDNEKVTNIKIEVPNKPSIFNVIPGTVIPSAIKDSILGDHIDMDNKKVWDELYKK